MMLKGDYLYIFEKEVSQVLRMFILSGYVMIKWALQ